MEIAESLTVTDSEIFIQTDGKHETQEGEEKEADLHKNVKCTKNPGHNQFVPVDDFNVNHLPQGYQDNSLVWLIKAESLLTVRICVTKTSKKRPDVWPKSKEAYPFNDRKGSDVRRVATGKVITVDQQDKEKTCQCHKCKHLNSPSKVRGEIAIYTATHVVFNTFEAKHTTCRFFFDRQDSQLITLGGWMVVEAAIEEDLCLLKCETCDGELLSTLEIFLRFWHYLRTEVNTKYESFRDKDKLIFIVSHPHGCPKQVSVGHWINKKLVDDNRQTRYTYAACTCPGSSGAHVNVLGYNSYIVLCHVHSGANSDGLSFSNVGYDW